MKKLVLAATVLAVSATPVLAQDATAVGTGIARSTSVSASRATAISGQGGTGIGTGGNPSAVLNVQGAPSQTTTSVVNSGHSSVTTVPSVFAPGLSAAGLETCLGSVSVGASWLGTGLTGGGTIPDAGCAARLDARTLWSFGLRSAAVARLCLGDDIRRSMPDICARYLPQPAPVYPAGYPAPVAVPTRYAGGPIMLVEGATGQDRLCNDYDEAKQRCRAWANVAGSHHKRVAAVKPAASPAAPAQAVAETKKEGN